MPTTIQPYNKILFSIPTDICSALPVVASFYRIRQDTLQLLTLPMEVLFNVDRPLAILAHT